MGIKKQYITWEEFEQIQGGTWTPSPHTHVKVDITNTPWAWADVSKTGSNLTDLTTRQHAGLSDAPVNAHHAQLHAASHHVAGGDLLAFASITGFSTYLDQAVKQASSPIFAGLIATTIDTSTEISIETTAATIARYPGQRIYVYGVGHGVSGFSVAGGTKAIPTIVGGGTWAGIFNFCAHDGTNFNEVARIAGWTDTNFAVGRYDGRLSFFTGDGVSASWNHERMRIDSLGNVGIGKAPTCKLDVNGTIKATQFYLNLGGLLDVTLGSLEEGETIRYDQATTMWIDAWGIDYDNPRLVYKIYTDFISASEDANPPWIGSALPAGGTRASVAGTSNHPGIVRFNSVGVLNSGFRFVTFGDWCLIAGAEHSEFCFKTPADLTNVRVRLGYQDSFTNVAPTDGVYIDINGTTLTGKTYNNTANSTTGAADPLVVSTWYRAKIAVSSDASEVIFILYSAAGTQLWSDTLATNIPTATGRETGHGAVAWMGVAAGRVLIDIDMMIATRAGYITR